MVKQSKQKIERLLGSRTKLPVVCGLDGTDVRFRMAHAQEFLYFDHAYFNRGLDKGNFRLCRNAPHLTYLLDRPTDRLKKLGVRINPWRPSGNHILVIPPSGAQVREFALNGWLETALEVLKTRTDRPVVVKHNKGQPLQPMLADAHALVCWSSVAAVEAALFGIPVFSSPHCPSWPIDAGRDYDNPILKDREPWAASLAYATWNVDELDQIDLEDYQYACRNHL